MNAAACRDLWGAVLERQIKDAAGKALMAGGSASEGSRKALIAQADAWMRGNSDDFKAVCTMAGIDPRSVWEAHDQGVIDVDVLCAEYEWESSE